MEPRHLVPLIAVTSILIVGLIVTAASFYKVDESQYALQLRFGKVHSVRTTPGLYPKMPFTDSIHRIDKRTLRADIPPREVPDQDKERLIIDIVVRYQITDPLAFRRTLRSEATARDRLQTIVYSAMRDTIAQHDRTHIIGAAPRVDDQGKQVSNDEGLPLYDSLVNTRDHISADIHRRIADAVTSQQYGINVISADIKRADFPPQVTSSIVDRLIAERTRVAARHRADGEEEYRKRTAAVQAQADILIAEANRDARQTRGEGDAQAIALVQEALEKDPEFYSFLRTLESYQDSITPGSTLVITDQPNGYLQALTTFPKDKE